LSKLHLTFIVFSKHFSSTSIKQSKFLSKQLKNEGADLAADGKFNEAIEV